MPDLGLYDMLDLAARLQVRGSERARELPELSTLRLSHASLTAS